MCPQIWNKTLVILNEFRSSTALQVSITFLPSRIIRSLFLLFKRGIFIFSKRIFSLLNNTAVRLHVHASKEILAHFIPAGFCLASPHYLAGEGGNSDGRISCGTKLFSKACEFLSLLCQGFSDDTFPPSKLPIWRIPTNFFSYQICENRGLPPPSPHRTLKCLGRPRIFIDGFVG